MINLVKLIFSIAWIISSILIAYMFYVTVQTTYTILELWGYATIYGLSFLGSSILTYNVLFLNQKNK